MSDVPDSPEAVALELLKMIRDAEGEQEPRRNTSARTYLLDVFADMCRSPNRSDTAGVVKVWPFSS